MTVLFAVPRCEGLAIRLAGFIFLCTALSACQTVGPFVGWATIGADGLVPDVPTCAIPSGSAVLCRDRNNALGLAISPLMTRGTQESWTANQYEIQLRLHGPKALAKNPRLLLPLFHSAEFGLAEVFEDLGKSQVVVRVNASSIGLDLFGAALMSPGGVQGVLLGAGGEVFELDAKFGRRNEAVGRVWLSSRRTHLLLESKVEYATLWSVQAADSTSIAQTVLRPGQLKWILLCEGCTDLKRLRYHVIAVPTVPQLSYWFQ